MEWTIPALAFPAKAGIHLPTPEGWKAELAWVAAWLHNERNVRHPELKLDTGQPALHTAATEHRWTDLLASQD